MWAAVSIEMGTSLWLGLDPRGSVQSEVSRGLDSRAVREVEGRKSGGTWKAQVLGDRD